jgi:hypothetical protein
MKIKVIKFTSKVRILGGSTPTGITINGSTYLYDKVYTVGSDISKEDYEENKDLFRTIKQEKNG